MASKQSQILYRGTRDQQNRISLGEEAFSVAARVAMQLGRESISNSIVAISELVKNAYDADAERVRIRFAGLGTDHPLLVIEDDGNGTPYEELRRQWMIIGTSNKLVTQRSSKKKRVLTGEKGLGRLGLDRLSKKTVVRTFSIKEERGTELVIDWSKYEALNERLESIKHELYSIRKDMPDPITQSSKSQLKGTQLILYGLKDSWTKEFLIQLKQELTLLVSPFTTIHDFSIEIEIDSGMNWNEIDGKVGSEYMLQVAEWRLEAELDENGQLSYFLSSPKYSERFEFPATPWEERFPKSTKPLCGALRFEMYFFLRRAVTLADLSLSTTQVNNFLNANQGIRIYRDGFRVKPYGEPDGTGDWLNLSYRRQQHAGGVRATRSGGWRVGYNQILGAVFIGRDTNPSLIDQTNRENLIEGPAFSDLKRFALDAVRFFELHRQEFEKARPREEEAGTLPSEQDKFEEARQKADSSSQASTEAVESLKTATIKVKKLLKEAEDEGKAPNPAEIRILLDHVVTTVDQTVSKAQEANQKFARVAKENEEELQHQKDTLGNLASLGILAASFGHETLGAANVVATNAKQLKHNIKGLFWVTVDDRKRIEENIEFILHDAEKIETFAEFTLRNITRDKRKRRKVYLNQVVRQVFSYFDKSLSEKNVSIELNLPATVSPILAFQIDWESIFVNLITNAVWALENTPADAKAIRVKMEETDGFLKIAFADSGCGLASGTEEQIFLATFSTKCNSKGEVIGTGMGLTIVKDFIESHKDGVIHVESPCDLGGVQFHLQVSVPNLADRGPTRKG
jgi:signal transduction histidine kinase